MIEPRPMRITPVAVAGLALATTSLLAAGTAAEPAGYQTPPRAIADLVDVPPTPSAELSPDATTLLLRHHDTLPSIAEVSRPELRIAGLRIDPRTNGPSRRAYLSGLSLLDVQGEKARPRPITGVPAGSHIAETTWSPDGARIAFTVTGDSGITLWVADRATGVATRVLDRLNAAGGAAYAWSSDGSIVARTVPASRSAAPARPTVPTGPVVQENDGARRPARTNPDLLKDAHDERLLDHYLATQLVRVAADGTAKPLGAPGLHVSATPSPDGAHVLVATVHRPYSYKVDLGRFPTRIAVWSRAGTVEKVLVDKPLAEEVPIDFGAVPTGPRAHQWRADADATVCWAEARDGGDPKRAAAVRDEVLCAAAPWRGQPTRIAALALRYGGVSWGDAGLALVDEWWWADRRSRTWMIAPGTPAAAPRVLWDRSWEDRYSDPGTPVRRRTPRGTLVLHRTPRGTLLLTGDGASDQGDRPFLDELDLTTGKSERRWRSEAPAYEYVVDTVDATGDTVVTRRETVSEPPQYYVRGPRGAPRKLTSFPHPNPALARAGKQLIRYTRGDGVKLSAMLYTPAGFQAGTSRPLPCLMWAYPSEYKTRDAAGQVQDSPYRFVRASPSGPLFALLRGYAVVDDPQMPIVGEGSAEPNDTYVAQLVAGAQAAADEVVRLRVCDKDRLAIGGHSYGAFTAANLLAHSNVFRAAIARSGAYNRTLTPFGFQAEERTYWQAAKTYIDMSPFGHADKIDEPLLLIHGEVDDNSGTYPIQSERLFEAMKGLGGRVRYVVLPAETHGYKARESVLHMLWEMSTWLDRHVKPPRKR
jgi:dipeptidyl aminopeptidase/acylaminoacyl peptidase